MSIRQGEIRRLPDGLAVVVLSNDNWNERLPPLVAPIMRGQPGPDMFPAVIALHESDPYGGGVVMTNLTNPPPANLSQPLGMVTGTTMQRLREAVADIVAD